MDNPNCNTKRRKGQHLTYEERVEMEIRLRDGWSKYRIAKHLGCSYNTIKNEYEKGKVALYDGKVYRYKASVGQNVYLIRRQNSKRNYHCLESVDFLKYVEEKVENEGWSLDACVGYAKENHLFSDDEMVCTKTLYNYVDLGLLSITNMDLPEKLSRKTKTKRVRKNRKNLGKSIEERPENVELREEFGHWEIDSVIGKKKDTESAVMTIVERKSRMSLRIKVKNHTAEAIDKALTELIPQFGDKYNEIFKSIMGDNGSEFANLSKLESMGIPAYFTHPYTSCEKGTNECHNRMLRRFIPKGKSIDDYSAEDILFFADKINNLPRKILNYHTPEELFEKQLDLIYAA
ncbi:MAG: IS30 family transposase [Clostridiales bacterium]|nr:IS30 family transposase [Clostridiales bacterium]